MAKKKLNQYQKRLFRLVVDGLLSTIALLFSVLATGYFVAGEGTLYYFPVACFFMAALYVSHLLLAKPPLIIKIKDIGLSVIYISMMVVSFFVPANISTLQIVTVLFSTSMFYDAVLSTIYKHKPRNIIFGILKSIFASLILIIYIVVGIEGSELVVFAFAFIPLFMAIIAFVHAMLMVFSGVRKTTLVTIVRKTYTIEILYGLVVLIVATALTLSMVEENMPISDSLWYCFALVTTIGFGDVTASSLIGRILSVILGVYGIVVVALITSIIVNFYNETKAHEPKNQELIDELKQLEEQRNSEETEDNKETKE